MTRVHRTIRFVGLVLVALMAASAGADVTGDVDGDGAADPVRVKFPPEEVRSRMRCTNEGECPAKLVVELTRLGRRSARLAVGNNVYDPRVLGIVDVDRDGRGEIFVEVGRGAGTIFFAVVRLLDARLESMRLDGRPATFPLGGTVMHFAYVGCTDGSLVTGGTMRNDDGASGAMTAYRLDGNVFVQERSRRFEWTCPESAQSCPTFEQLDASGMADECPGLPFN